MNMQKTLSRRFGLVIFSVCFLTMVVYGLSSAPTFLWSDSSKLTLYVLKGDLWGTGFEKHFMHSWFGLLFFHLPVSAARSQHLMSGFFGALTVGCLLLILRRFIGSLPAIVLAVGSFAVSHLFWLYASINETYTMVTFFLLTVWYASLMWVEKGSSIYGLLIGLLMGMGFATHGMMLLFSTVLLIYGIQWLKTQQPGWARILLFLVLFAGGFIAGAFPIFILPLFHGYSVVQILEGLKETTALHSSIYRGGIGKMFREILRFPFYLAYQYPGPSLILIVAGIPYLFRRLNPWDRLALAVYFMVQTGFASMYFFQRQFAMLIPVFMLCAFFLAAGIERLWPVFERKLKRPVVVLSLTLVVLPPLVYFGTWQMASRLEIPLPIRVLPYRDNYRYFLFPPKWMEYGAERYATDAFRQASKNALILADFNPGMALVYARDALGIRPDVDIDLSVDGWVHAFGDPAHAIMAFLKEQIMIHNRTVYLADRWEPYYRVSYLEHCFEIAQDGGPLWRVTPKTTPDPVCASQIISNVQD